MKRIRNTGSNYLPGSLRGGTEEHVGDEEAENELHPEVSDGCVSELVPGPVPAVDAVDQGRAGDGPAALGADVHCGPQQGNLLEEGGRYGDGRVKVRS